MKKGSVYILPAFFFALTGTGLTRSQSQHLMYGHGETTYGDGNAKSGMVEMGKSIVPAAGVLDSLGKPQSTTVFKNKSGE